MNTHVCQLEITPLSCLYSNSKLNKYTYLGCTKNAQKWMFSYTVCGNAVHDDKVLGHVVLLAHSKELLPKSTEQMYFDGHEADKTVRLNPLIHAGDRNVWPIYFVNTFQLGEFKRKCLKEEWRRSKQITLYWIHCEYVQNETYYQKYI